MANKSIQINPTEKDYVLTITKKNGNLSIKEISDALKGNNIEECFAIFIKATQFDGYVGDDDKVSSVELHNVSWAEECPVCQKNLDENYNAAYQHGYQNGTDDRIREA